jgi:hypothetical protein
MLLLCSQMVKPLPSDLVVKAQTTGRVSLSVDRSKDSAVTSSTSYSSTAATTAAPAMTEQGAAGAQVATAERVAAAGVVMGDSADSLQGRGAGSGSERSAKAASVQGVAQTGLQGGSSPRQGSASVDGMRCECEPVPACSSPAVGGAGATSTAPGSSEGAFRRLSDTAASEASSAIPMPKRRTSLTMQSLRRLSVDQPSGELCRLELSHAGGGLLKVHVPLDTVEGSPYDGELGQEASREGAAAATAAAAGAGTGRGSAGAAAAMDVLDGSGSSSFVQSCLHQANTEPDYEVRHEVQPANACPCPHSAVPALVATLLVGVFACPQPTLVGTEMHSSFCGRLSKCCCILHMLATPAVV